MMGCDGHHEHEGHVHCYHPLPRLCGCGFVVMLLVCTGCAEAVETAHRCRSGACRSLAAADAPHEKQSFVDWLSGEDPVDHILEIHESSGANEGAVAWLVHSVR
jgi:hypothetical protein